MKNARGYTLVELIVAVGLFALVMLLASGAYLMMIGINRQAQGIATGIDNLAFALETMTRDIRTGTEYSCAGNNCNSFSFKNSSKAPASYSCSGVCSPSSPGALQETVNGTTMTLTDPSVKVTALNFYTEGLAKGDGLQPRVTIVIKGTVTYAAGKQEDFAVETGATMRGSDL